MKKKKKYNTSRILPQSENILVKNVSWFFFIKNAVSLKIAYAWKTSFEVVLAGPFHHSHTILH